MKSQGKTDGKAVMLQGTGFDGAAQLLVLNAMFNLAHELVRRCAKIAIDLRLPTLCHRLPS